MVNPAMDLFWLEDMGTTARYAFNERELEQLALANDARTLAYSSCTSKLQSALSANGSVDVRYIGGPFPGERFAVQMPLWFDAVLRRAQTAADIPAIILEFRQRAEPFRRRKRVLEKALAERDAARIAQHLQAL
jgi:hypothetical protein